MRSQAELPPAAWRGDDLSAGIAHQHVDSSELLDPAGDAGVHLLLVCDIHRGKIRSFRDLYETLFN
jgi:hypothetical protein